MKKAKWFTTLMIGMSLILFCTILPSATNAAQYGGILKIVDMAEGAQPIGVPWENQTIDTKLMPPVIETLLMEDVSGKVSPHLAKDYKIDVENKTITFWLHEGIKFHDGTDFNAEAAKWCIEKAIENKVARGWESVEVVDDYTVRIHFKNYRNDYLNRAASRSTGMISPTAFEKNGIEWARWHPVGTGPFKFVKFQRGNILEYTKNENYWIPGKPYLDGIQFLFIRDPLTQQAALRTKDPNQRIDVLSITSGEQAAMMKAQGFEVLSMPIGPISMIPDSANADSPLSNRKVREAVSYAIDREGIVKARGFGIWKPAYQFQPDVMPTYIPDLEGRRYNPEKAKQLLKEAGYPNGFKTKMIVMPAMVDRDAMVAVQRNLEDVGIQAELEFPDMGGYMNYRFQGWHNGFMVHHTRALANFNLSFSIYFLPNYKQFPSLQRTDGLIPAIEASNNTPEPSKEKGQPLERIIYEDAMVIPLYYVYELYVLRSTVHDTGYTKWSGSSVFSPENVWLSKD
jgi:peptide/nickel transport system substrate-binding protein